MAAEWILVLILSLSLMGTALFEMATHGFICVDGKTRIRYAILYSE